MIDPNVADIIVVDRGTTAGTLGGEDCVGGRVVGSEGSGWEGIERGDDIMEKKRKADKGSASESRGTRLAY